MGLIILSRKAFINRLFFSCALPGALLIVASAVWAQDAEHADQHTDHSAQHAEHTAQDAEHTAQDAQHSAQHAGMVDMSPAGMFLMNLASGTAANPASSPMPMVMMHFGKWNTTFMGTAFVDDTQQSGPRGADKFYAPNWFMTSAQHRAGPKGSFEADLMLSLEPATVTDRRYPLLFQTGETAYGLPLVDAQHPHNFILGLGFHYTHQLADETFLDTYFAPVGDPALGPVAYPHRASAMELPQATLSHHWQDSSHIADDVITLGISHQLLVGSFVVLSHEKLGGTSFTRAARSSRGSGARRSSAHDRVVALHQAD